MGLEPTTFSVLGWRSTNWATEAAQLVEYKSPIQFNIQGTARQVSQTDNRYSVYIYYTWSSYKQHAPGHGPARSGPKEDYLLTTAVSNRPGSPGHLLEMVLHVYTCTGARLWQNDTQMCRRDVCMGGGAREIHTRTYSTYTCTCICMHVHTVTYTCTCTCMPTHVHVATCMHVYTYTCTCMHVHTHMYMHTHVHVCMYTYTCTCMHVHIHVHVVFYSLVRRPQALPPSAQ